jgi:hypothetical protein
MFGTLPSPLHIREIEAALVIVHRTTADQAARRGILPLPIAEELPRGISSGAGSPRCGHPALAAQVGGDRGVQPLHGQALTFSDGAGGSSSTRCRSTRGAGNRSPKSRAALTQEAIASRALAAAAS